MKHTRRTENNEQPRKVSGNAENRRDSGAEPQLERHLEEAIQLATD